MAENLRGWMIEKIPFLEDGHNYYQIPGVPFQVHVWKNSSAAHSTFGIGVFDPGERTKADDILNKKIEKLNKPRYHDCERILLVENSDISLMNEFVMQDIVMDALSGISLKHPDSIWFAHSVPPDRVEFYQLTTFPP